MFYFYNKKNEKKIYSHKIIYIIILGMDTHVQDWTHTVIRKNKKTVKSSPIVVKKQHLTNSTKTTFDENGNEVVKLKFVSRDMAQFIIKERMTKKLTQKELAKLSNIDVKTLEDIERAGSTNVIYNAIQINKIAKALSVNIPRK
jgi:ribosome-binding protein aMBF1 (putative translation factor)